MANYAEFKFETTIKLFAMDDPDLVCTITERTARLFQVAHLVSGDPKSIWDNEKFIICCWFVDRSAHPASTNPAGKLGALVSMLNSLNLAIGINSYDLQRAEIEIRRIEEREEGHVVSIW